MMNSLLIRTLLRFPAKELVNFCDYVHCPMFNRRAEVTRLCDYLAGALHKSDRKALDAERLFAAAFPGRAFDVAALRHVMSYLLEAARQYLSLMEWRADLPGQQRYLIRALHHLGLETMAEKEWRGAKAMTENAEVQDAQYHFGLYQLHQEQLERTARQGRSGFVDLRPLPDALTVFYMAEMLRHACSALSHQAIAGQAHHFEWLERILQALESAELSQTPVVAVYLQTYKMLSSAESEPFDRLKDMLVQYERCFSREELRSLYLLAINGCIRRMNAGQRAYIREAFELYRAALERDFLTDNGLLSGFTYKNIIRIGVALGEHVWTEAFLERYREALHPRERDNMYLYNLAFLHFQQHDYARAMPLLRQVDLDDTLNNLDARRMLLRSYFELGEWQALESLLQSFAVYLRRQKNLGYHRISNEKLLYFTKKLMVIDRSDQKSLSRVLAEIDGTGEVAERVWLRRLAGGEATP